MTESWLWDKWGDAPGDVPWAQAHQPFGDSPMETLTKIDISKVSKLNEYSLTESYWEITDAPTNSHLSLKLNTLQNAHLQSKINASRIQELIKNIKIRITYSYIKLRCNSHTMKYIFFIYHYFLVIKIIGILHVLLLNLPFFPLIKFVRCRNQLYI